MNFGYIYAYFTYLCLLPFLWQRPLTIFLQVPLSCAVFPPLPFFCFPSLNISAWCFLACLSCVFLGVLSCGLRRVCPSHLHLLYFIFKRGLIFFCRKSVLLIFLGHLVWRIGLRHELVNVWILFVLEISIPPCF